jgi:hypothetical protein
VGAYFPGGRSNKHSIKNFKSDLNQFNSLRGKYIVAGDFNCRHTAWKCLKNNEWGKILNEKLISSAFKLSYTTTPTYIPKKSKHKPSTIDVAISNISNHLSNPVTLNDLNSDHLPVTLSINLDVQLRENPHILLYKKTNWKRFNRVLSTKLQEIQSVEINSVDDLDEKVNKFHDKNSCVPKKTLIQKDWLPKLNEHILGLKTSRNIERRNWQRYRRINHRVLFKYYDRLTQKNIFELRNNSWNSSLSQLDKGSKPFWNLTKVLKKRKIKSPAFQIDNEIISSEDRKASALADYFSKQHSLTNSYSDPTTESTVEESISALNESRPAECQSFQTHEVISALKSVKIRKSPGKD